MEEVVEIGLKLVTKDISINEYSMGA